VATDPMTDTPAFAVLPQEQVGLLFRAALDPEGTGDLSERDAAALARVEQNLAAILAERDSA